MCPCVHLPTPSAPPGCHQSGASAAAFSVAMLIASQLGQLEKAKATWSHVDPGRDQLSRTQKDSKDSKGLKRTQKDSKGLKERIELAFELGRGLLRFGRHPLWPR